MAKIKVDFKGVEAGGGRPRLPEGDYLAKVTDVKAGESKKGNSMLTWEFTITTPGKGKGKKFKSYTTLNKEALWKLKQLLEAMGLKVPNGSATLDLDKYMGREVGVTLVDEEYDNKMHSTISDFIPAADLDEDDDDEDEDEDESDEEDDDEEDEVEEKPKAKKKRTKSKKVDDDDDEDIEDIDLDSI